MLLYRKSFGIRYARRSETMPPPAIEVKYHPSSVNLLLIRKLIEDSMAKNHRLSAYLTEQYSNIDRRFAQQIISRITLRAHTYFYPEFLIRIYPSSGTWSWI
jgi:DNA topoisomerase VI subunit B